MILIKEEFVGGEKWRRAVELGASDAIVLWLAMKCYCSAHPDTEGFVPSEDLDRLPGAPRRARKALEALRDCGRKLPSGERGAGLVEPVEGGWRLHDYLDHSASPEEVELRREKARLRQQSHRDNKRRELAAVKRLMADTALPEGEGVLPPGGPLESTAHVTPGERDNPCDSRRDTGETSHPIARPREGGRAPAPTRARPHPSPSQPSPTKNLRTLASTIRDLWAPLGEAETTVEASAWHRQFAAEHGIDLEPLLAELRAAPSSAALSPDELRARLATLLVAATGYATPAEQPRALGGAA